MNLRAGIVAVALSPILGITACTGDPDELGAPERSVSVSPRGVTCPGDSEPNHVDYDHPGYPTLSAMLKSQSQNAGAISVDLETQRIYFLRDDGTAHRMTTWGRGSQHHWYPDSASICDDSKAWEDVQPTVSAPLTLTVGHCWIEPVRFDGRDWDVVEEDQFGLGGGYPASFVSTGTVWVAGDLLFYEDESGAPLTLVPAGDPLTIEWKGCD